MLPSTLSPSQNRIDRHCTSTMGPLGMVCRWIGTNALLAVGLMLCLSPIVVSAQGSPTDIAVQPVFDGLHRPTAVESDENGNVYVLVRNDHSILVFDTNQQALRRIGSIGKGPSELYYPFDFAVRLPNVYVADRGNDRVQVFDHEGRWMTSFAFPSPNSVNVLSGGEIIVTGGSTDDSLISVYDPSGARRLGSIGEKIKFDTSDPRLSSALNRARLTVDRMTDDIYCIFEGHPDALIRKYSREGILLAELSPAGHTVIDDVRAEARSNLKKKLGGEKTGITRTLNGMEIQPDTRSMWILPGGPAIYEYTPDGRVRTVYQLFGPQGEQLGARDIAFVGSSKAYLVNAFSAYLLPLRTAPGDQ